MDNAPEGVADIPTPMPLAAMLAVGDICSEHAELAEVLSKKDLQAIYSNVQKFQKLTYSRHVVSLQSRESSDGRNSLT